MLAQELAFQLNIVHCNGTIFLIPTDTLHTVITNFAGIQVTSVAFTTTDAHPVIQNALLLFFHLITSCKPIIAQLPLHCNAVKAAPLKQLVSCAEQKKACQSA